MHYSCHQHLVGVTAPASRLIPESVHGCFYSAQCLVCCMAICRSTAHAGGRLVLSALQKEDTAFLKSFQKDGNICDTSQSLSKAASQTCCALACKQAAMQRKPVASQHSQQQSGDQTQHTCQHVLPHSSYCVGLTTEQTQLNINRLHFSSANE
jgi:hypothetical protein